MLLAGELGIGKTRLLEEVAKCAVQDGATVLRGGASESEGMPPYLPFLEALGQYIRVTPPDQLREQVAVAPQILASLLPELAVRLDGELPVAYPLPPEQARLRLYEAVGTFLEGISAPHGLVLMLDDLHWADTASLDLLCYIARHHAKARLLVLGSYREGEINRNPALERTVTELIRRRVLTTVAVNPLSAEEIEALAAGYLGGPISPIVSQLLHAQSEGNPFFAEELIRGWLEVGALVQENNQWVAVRSLEHSLPSSIVGALRQRFTRLSSAHYRMALELLDPGDERYGTLLLSLGKAALMAGVQNEAVVAYEGALTRLSEYSEHGMTARAAHGLGLAHWRQGALQAARAALEHALVLLGNSPSAETVRVPVDLSTLLTVHIGQQAEGAAYAQQALEIARQLEDKSLEAAASRAVAGRLFLSGNEISLALQPLKRALVLAEESDDPFEAAKCCFYLAGAYYWKAEIRHSYQVSMRGVAFIERSHQQYQLRIAYSWLALLLASQGEWLEAEQAIERVQCMSNPLPSAFLRQIRGFLAYQRENYAAAEREFQAALVNQQTGSIGLMFYAGLLGMAQAASGKREEASASMVELEALLAALPPCTLPIIPTMICLALIAIALGDWERAANLYPRLQAFSGQHYWFLVDRVLGEIATLCGDWDMAMVHLSAAEEKSQSEGLRPELARTLLAQATCELARGGQENITQATNLLKRALTLFEELKMTDAAGRIRNQLHTFSRQPHRSPPQSLPADLTASEAKVLQLVVEGKSNRQIAQELGLSEKTVANHLTHVFNKTNSENRAAAAAFAIRHRLA